MDSECLLLSLRYLSAWLAGLPLRRSTFRGHLLLSRLLCLLVCWVWCLSLVTSLRHGWVLGSLLPTLSGPIKATTHIWVDCLSMLTVRLLDMDCCSGEGKLPRSGHCSLIRLVLIRSVLSTRARVLG